MEISGSGAFGFHVSISSLLSSTFLALSFVLIGQWSVRETFEKEDGSNRRGNRLLFGYFLWSFFFSFLALKAEDNVRQTKNMHGRASK